MRSCAMKALSIAATLVLACAGVPSSAYAEVQDTVQERAALDERAAQIDAQADSFTPGQVIITYRTAQAESAVAPFSVGNAQDAQVLATDESEATATALIPLSADDSVGQAVARMERRSDVVSVQPNYRHRLMDNRPRATVDDPYANVSTDAAATANQWWLYDVNAFGAWDYATADQSVTVAVLDIGINFEHRDLAANIDTAHAYDAHTDEKLAASPSNEEMAHGSHVAGIVSGVANNGFGIAGVSYNARILPICVFYLGYDPSVGRNVALCNDSDLIRAYAYLMGDDDGDGRTLAQETNTRVVNMSLGSYVADAGGEDKALEDVIDKAADQGVLTVAAGGNGDAYGNARTDKSEPSDFDSVVSVTAVDSANANPSWSDYNAYKDLTAPGVDIWSTWYVGDRYACNSGTSMASPLVAGVAALLFAYNPGLTVDEAKDALCTTATDLGAPGRDDHFGHGLVNARAALEKAGAVSIEGASSMTQTVVQKLTVRDAGAASGVASWMWSVDEPSIVRMDDDGTVTALAPGTAVVTVAATDDASVVGHKTITVSPIALPVAPQARSSEANRSVTVSWPAAPAARVYQVYRAEGADSAEGAYRLVGSVAAEGDGACSFEDDVVVPGTVYWYRVLPQGMLDGAVVNGELSEPISVQFADRTQLSALLDTARADRSSTPVSADGADLYASEQWVSAQDAAALDAVMRSAATTLYQKNATQAQVDSAYAALIAAVEAFDAAKKPGQVPDPLRWSGWQRLAGADALDTMAQVVRAGWSAADTVYLASSEGYWDALSASGAAGLSGAPVVMTGGESLSVQAAALLGRYKPRTVVVCGGEAALSPDVAAQAAAAAGGARVVRCAGADAVGTAIALYREAPAAVPSQASFGDTAWVATDNGYWDALAAAPVTYAQHEPIFLTHGADALSRETIDAMKAGGIARVYIAGGPLTISPAVERQLEDADIAVAARFGGPTAVETSLSIAQHGIDAGMGADGMGVATTDGYWDALSGAALCGARGSVLALVNAPRADRVAQFVQGQRTAMRSGYVFGGSASVSQGIVDVLDAAARG